MSDQPAPDAAKGVDLQEVLGEMDDRTRVGWDAAFARVQNRQQERVIADQARRIAELENAQAPTKPPSVHPTVPGENGEPVAVPS